MSTAEKEYKANIICPHCGEEHGETLPMGLNPFICKKCREFIVIGIKLVPKMTYFTEAEPFRKNDEPEDTLQEIKEETAALLAEARSDEESEEIGEESSAEPDEPDGDDEEPIARRKEITKYGHLPVKEQEMQKVIFSFDGQQNSMELSKKGYPWKSSIIARLASMKKKKEKVYGTKVKTVLISIDGTTYNEEVE